MATLNDVEEWRDVAAEVLTASHLLRAGLSPRLRETPDLSVDVAGRLVGVEVRRIRQRPADVATRERLRARPGRVGFEARPFDPTDSAMLKLVGVLEEKEDRLWSEKLGGFKGSLALLVWSDSSWNVDIVALLGAQEHIGEAGFRFDGLGAVFFRESWRSGGEQSVSLYFPPGSTRFPRDAADVLLAALKVAH